MLIVFAGLPGTGKSTVAKELARAIAAVYIRIDTLEQAFIGSVDSEVDIGPAGYIAGYAVAKDNLGSGLTVIADSVNALQLTRDAWRSVAAEMGVGILEVELICADASVHRQRVEARQSDISGHKLPTWKRVIERQYDLWDVDHLVIDTARVSVSQAVDHIVNRMKTLE
ncbi:AAA family ATPase [Pandoraea sp. NPDC090278]|uniref:AAA family ATPase n=1 Tax=Pandoraea sp. NPDC090278 TaxID=3364391 RepID=UPI00383B4EA9